MNDGNSSVADIAAIEAARAVGYAGVGALVLKGAEFLPKTFGITKAVQDTERAARQKELEGTLGAAAQMREELRKDNEELRRRMREMETRLATLEAEHHELRLVNDRLREENADLKAEKRLREAHDRGRLS